MSTSRPTRRQLLGAVAAASLAAPGDGLAAALAPTVFSMEVGHLVGSTGELAGRWRFVLAGVEWSGPLPLTVTGAVVPAKRYATVTLYALRGSHRQRVAAVRAHVQRGGTFSATFGARRPGTYVLVARIAADPRNTAGTSPPAQLAI